MRSKEVPSRGEAAESEVLNLWNGLKRSIELEFCVGVNDLQAEIVAPRLCLKALRDIGSLLEIALTSSSIGNWLDVVASHMTELDDTKIAGLVGQCHAANVISDDLLDSLDLTSKRIARLTTCVRELAPVALGADEKFVKTFALASSRPELAVALAVSIMLPELRADIHHQLQVKSDATPGAKVNRPPFRATPTEVLEFALNQVHTSL